MKFTFKTEKSPGSYSSFFPHTHFIKLKKNIVGKITDRKWIIRLMVVKSDIIEDGNPNCKWKWVELTQKSNSLQEAKDWLNEHCDELQRVYTLHSDS